MAKITVKGKEYTTITISGSFNRRALQFKSNIILNLKKLGISEYDINIPIEIFAIKKAQASVTWYFEGHHLYYSFNLLNNFVENLYIVSKVIELEVHNVLVKETNKEDFIHKFSEDKDIEDKRKKAREILGVSHDSLDFELINKKYKVLAKEHHPDTPNGNTEKFKEINNAHKILKRELEL